VDTQDRALREDVHMPKKKRRRFTAEQKADAVRLVREVGSLALVARDLDLTQTCLRN
jgi:transposase-like protein